MVDSRTKNICQGKLIRNDALAGPKDHKSGVVLEHTTQWWVM